MSWKLRRAHYYQRQRVGGIDPEVAKTTNLIFLISLLFSLLFFALAMGQSDTDNPLVAIVGLFGLISLITTPILFLFFLGGIQHGLPNFAAGKSQRRSYIENEKYITEKRKRELDENKQKWQAILKKAEKNPNIDLYDNQYVSVIKTHKARLKKFKKSKYNGIMYKEY